MDRRAWVLAWSFVALMFVGFWSYGLFDLDEGIYAAATAEMLRNDEWIMVTLRGQPFFEKPILVYWAAMAMVKLGIPGEAALRVPSVLATVGTLAVVAAFARRRFSGEIAFWAMLILASSALFMMLGRMFTPDAMLICFMTAAYLSFWESLVGDLRWRLATAATLGLATLAKGPMPVFVFFALVVYLAWRNPEMRPRMRQGWVIGTVIFLAIVTTWYVPAMLRSDAFFSEFILKQNLGRLQGTDTVHQGPFWLYVPVVLIGLAPFSLMLAGAWRTCRVTPLEKYLWAWAIVVFVLFSFAGSKLPHYILPTFPPLAILLAKTGMKAARGVRWVFVAYGLVASLGLAFALAYLPEAFSPLYLAAFAAATGAIIALVLGREGAIAASQGFAVAAPLAAVVILLGPRIYWLHTHLGPRTVATAARLEGLPVVEYQTGARGERGKTAHPSMLWYLGAITQTAETPAELRAGREGKELVISRLDRFEGLAAEMRAGGAVVDKVKESGEFQLYRVDFPK
ncbi:MAG: ArnT family glycosyltransferase [Fimbriimonadales bacterium]